MRDGTKRFQPFLIGYVSVSSAAWVTRIDVLEGVPSAGELGLGVTPSCAAAESLLPNSH